MNSQINPEDSASQIGSWTASKSSTRQSRRSNRSCWHTSGTSSLTIARAKEAARIAELKAEAAAFTKRQSLEEQKFRLQQEQERLTLETEIAKSEAKEQSPHVRESKQVVDSGFHTLDSGFRRLDSGFHAHGFRIPNFL